MDFVVDSYFNPHLAVGAGRIDAILTITATDSKDVAGEAERAKKVVLFILDVSGSMEGDRIAMGKLALRKCIDLLDQDCLFSVIAFSSHAEIVLPTTLATAAAKEEAHTRIKRMSAGGGTEMSKALLAALSQLSGAGGAIGYAQFVTDGDNDPADAKALEDALGRCEGKFQCDCWGVGTKWKPGELRKIAGRLLGSADAVPNPEQLEVHFRDGLGRALSRGVGAVRLRLQTPKTSKIVSVKQMTPEIADLFKLSKRVDEKNLEVPLGAWSAESRDYHVVFDLEPQPDGEEMMVCRPRVVTSRGGAEVVAEGQRIVAAWTSDAGLTTRINAQVAHYTGQEELAGSIREGLEAKARGDVDEATKLLGKAAKIAIESGNEEVTRRLKKVVDVIDADTGTVRLRSGANKGDELELDMGGTRTVRRRPAAQGGEGGK